LRLTEESNDRVEFDSKTWQFLTLFKTISISTGLFGPYM